jgi:hypothetical protein
VQVGSRAGAETEITIGLDDLGGHNANWTATAKRGSAVGSRAGAVETEIPSASSGQALRCA